MAGLTLDTGGCRAAQGIAATRQGQCWVPHGQRKAWLGRLTLGTQGAAQGIARQGQCWVPHGQRKAWLGSRWVPMAWGITQGKTGCPRCSARHCQGKAECPRCSARGELPFPPHCSTLTTRIGEKLPFFHQCKTLVKRIGGKLPFFPYAKHWTA